MSKLAKLRTEFDNVKVLVIDETSMVTSTFLAHISNRLQDITGQTDLPFGGLSVLLLGDMYQLKPIGGRPLYNDVLDRSRLLKRYSPTCPRITGIDLFVQFKLKVFTQQMRASGDQVQTAFIQRLRDPSVSQPINDEIIRQMSLLQLSATDFYNNSDWNNALYVLLLNKERLAINNRLAQQFEFRSGVPVIRWRNQISLQTSHTSSSRSISMIPLTQQQEESLYDEELILWSTFVTGAPAFLTTNINPTKKLANGSAVIMRDIAFNLTDNNMEDMEKTKELIETAGPGQIVNIPIVPFSITVEVVDPTPGPWQAQETLQQGKLVIPILIDKNYESAKVGTQKKEIMIIRHSIDLGFAVTYEKVQSKTISKIVLDLNNAPTRTLSYSAFYVGTSRVKARENMRILPIKTGCSLFHLHNLKPDPDLTRWLAGYEAETGNWIGDSTHRQPTSF